MTIKRKASKATNYVQTDIEDKIDQVIERGGKTAVDEPIEKKSTQDEEIRFTLRIQSSLIKKIDSARKPRVGNVSRNQWILEVISNALD